MKLHRFPAAPLTLMAGLLLGAGCAQDSAFPPEPALGPDDAVVELRGPSYKQAPRYYTFAVLNDWFLDLEKVNTHNGNGQIFWTLDLEPDPEWGGVPSPVSMAFDLDGTMYTAINWFDFTPGHGKSQLARIDMATGEETFIGEPYYTSISGLDFDSCGNLYATGFETGCPQGGDPIVFGEDLLYQIDKYSGEATPIGPIGVRNLMDVAFDAANQLWGTVHNELYLIDLDTGTANFVLDITGVSDPRDVPGIPPEDWQYMELMSIAVDENNVLWGTAMRGCSVGATTAPVFRVDVWSGDATLVGYTGQPYNHGGDVQPSTVRIAHRLPDDGYRCMEVSINALPAHLAHGDYVPGTDGHDCECP